ncbi:MAG: MgtC/SapB family protein [Betaproteobacteria bacterium]|nr:MgtC/SapB family protein [Betaproteobacteria bacterium]
MSEDHMVMAGRLFAAVLAGGLIGLERSFRGRPAGFRTHTLVCLASTVLMLVTVYEWQWIQSHVPDSIRMDPTRMAQGIMTGIGFLGAGVIFKEGITVRGLTTAASIWITAALGILIGIGFYFPAAVTTALVIFVLSIFRWVESHMRTQNYARLDVAFRREETLDEADLRTELAGHGFDAAHMNYRVTETGDRFEYRMMIQTTHPENFGKLARSLSANQMVKEFRIAPAGD